MRAGAPAVLAWAKPVYDSAASASAALLYEQLAAAEAIDAAVAQARRHLWQLETQWQSEDPTYEPCWHMLRLYSDDTPPAPLVTPLATPERLKTARRYAAEGEFLDAEGKVKVATRERFVGRRRILQRCIRALAQTAETDSVILHGMGGLGKSSIAGRLLDRMPGHRRIVIVGSVDEDRLLNKLIDLPLDEPRIALLRQNIGLRQRLQMLLQEFLADSKQAPILFILDDFEANLQEQADGSFAAQQAGGGVLRALLGAIHDSGSDCRVIVTSRYTFPLPGAWKLREEGLAGLRGAELDKKRRFLDALSETAETDPALKEGAIQVADGNPRLLEWLDKVLAAGGEDHAAIITAMEATQAEFRENILAEKLLTAQTGEFRRFLALAALFALPVPGDAIESVCSKTTRLLAAPRARRCPGTRGDRLRFRDE